MTGIGHMNKQQDIKRLLGQFFGFLLRVVRVSCAIRVCSYPARLPIAPCCRLCHVNPLPNRAVHFIAEEQLLRTLSTYAGMVIRATQQFWPNRCRCSLRHRQAVGIIGFLAMLFFSSMAFGVLQSALSVIFFILSELAVATFSFPLLFLICMSFQSVRYRGDFVYYGSIRDT